ncbi:MAG: two-component system sensor histidine kinase AlgZ [Enterobacterales bacterium]|jgi:two-component system sensor histidine kinase AlgZ
MRTNYMNIAQSNNDKNGFFLPDFCHTRSVFMVILVSELLALILTLVRFQSDIFWLQLGKYSLIIQWIALLSTAMLCLSRPVLRRLSDLHSGIISYMLVLMVTLLVTVGAILVENWMQNGPAINLLEHPGLFGNLLVSAILSAVMLRFFYLQAQYRRRIVIAADAKLEALQARIHPHFLFNSMNIIAGLIPINPVLAERVIEDLSDLFRASLAEHRSQVSLQSEIDLCKRYLGIEQLRLGDRLQSKWRLPENIDSVSIPPLTLQPLIENAIYHGIQPLIDGGVVSIDVDIVKDSCLIRIENPLVSAPSSKTATDGNKMALNNVRERLDMLYQDKASLDMQIDNEKCVVVITLPLITLPIQTNDGVV